MMEKATSINLKITSDCSAYNIDTTQTISIPDDFESMTVLVYGKADGVAGVYASKNMDQIEKDNDDPMPFVRVISGLQRECSSDIDVSMWWSNDKTGDDFKEEIDQIVTLSSLTAADSEVIQMGKTQE